MSQKFVTRKVRANAVMEDDRIKVGGRLYRVVDNSTSYMSTDKRSLSAVPLDALDQYDRRINLNLPGHTKLKIYNQK